jgi:hypothetical protein
MMKRACTFVWLLAAVACGGGNSATPAPSGLNLSGAWKGTLAESRADTSCPYTWVFDFCGVGQSTWTLMQSGTAVSGTFILIMPGAVRAFDDSHGSVTGTLSGNTLNYTLNVTFAPPSSFTSTVNGTAQVTATNINGTYTGTNVHPGFGNEQFGNGQLALVKQ